MPLVLIQKKDALTLKNHNVACKAIVLKNTIWEGRTGSQPIAWVTILVPA